MHHHNRRFLLFRNLSAILNSPAPPLLDMGINNMQGQESSAVEVTQGKGIRNT